MAGIAVVCNMASWLHFFFFYFFVCFCLLRQGFSEALESVLELVLVDQAGLELTETCLPLPPECLD